MPNTTAQRSYVIRDHHLEYDHPVGYPDQVKTNIYVCRDCNMHLGVKESYPDPESALGHALSFTERLWRVASCEEAR